MSNIQAIEATREYLLTDTTFTKCDKCKQLFAKAINLAPVTKIHGFDDVNLCLGCLPKCAMIYNIDIAELIKAGTVADWLKLKK